MRRFQNLKIISKILVLLSLMALVTIVASIFTTNKMRYIDDTYGNLLDGPSKAALAIARANRNLVYIDRGLYTLISDLNQTNINANLKEISDTQGFFSKQIRIATRAMPEMTDSFGKIEKQFEKIMSTTCANTINFVKTNKLLNNNIAANDMRSNCDPALLSLMGSLSKLTNDINDINDQASNAAYEVTNSTIKNTYFIVIGGLILIVGLAIYMTFSSITTPIRRMVEILKELSNSNFKVYPTPMSFRFSPNEKVSFPPALS